MKTLQEIVKEVLDGLEKRLSPGAFSVRSFYANKILQLAEKNNITYPSDEFYKSCEVLIHTEETQFEVRNVIRHIDRIADTRAFTADGTLYNPPTLPDYNTAMNIIGSTNFPIPDDTIDISVIIAILKEYVMNYRLANFTVMSYSSNFKKVHIALYVERNTFFNRQRILQYISQVDYEHLSKNTCDAVWTCARKVALMILEYADTGSYEWKVERSKKLVMKNDELEFLRSSFADHLKKRNIKPGTIQVYDFCFRTLVEVLNISSVEDFSLLSRDCIKEMLISLSGRWKTSTYSRVLTDFRGIFSWLHESGYTNENFSVVIMKPRNKTDHIVPYLSKTDQDNIAEYLENASLRNKAMFAMLRQYGLRECDVCGLMLNQIDWHNDVINIIQQKTGVPMTLPLFPDVGNAIMEYILNERPKQGKDNPYVFITAQAPYRKLDSIYHFNKKMLANIEAEPVNEPDFCGTRLYRYTLTHNLLEAKVRHQVVTDILGHISKQSDKHYLSMEKDMLLECPLDLSDIGQKYWEEDQ